MIESKQWHHQQQKQLRSEVFVPLIASIVYFDVQCYQLPVHKSLFVQNVQVLLTELEASNHAAYSVTLAEKMIPAKVYHLSKNAIFSYLFWSFWHYFLLNWKIWLNFILVKVFLEFRRHFQVLPSFPFDTYIFIFNLLMIVLLFRSDTKDFLSQKKVSKPSTVKNPLFFIKIFTIYGNFYIIVTTVFTVHLFRNAWNTIASFPSLSIIFLTFFFCDE